jgi:hypothetical protein
VGAAEDIHRVDLDKTDPVDDPSEMTHVETAGGSRVGEALGAQRKTTGLVDGQSPHRPAT